MLASVPSATLLGIDGQLVEVEVHISNGLPSYTVVGLPDAAVRESRERVRAALISSEIEFPKRRITVNLAPAGVRKSGAGLELAVAAGLMIVGGDLPSGCLDGVGLIGELGLDGTVRRVPGVLALVDTLARAGVGTVVVPAGNAHEAALVDGVEVRPTRSLGELRCCLKGEMPWPPPPTLPPGDPTQGAPARWATSPTSGAWPSPAPPWRPRRRAATTCSSPAHPASARRCWRSGCRRSWSRSVGPRPSRSPGSTRRPARSTTAA